MIQINELPYGTAVLEPVISQKTVEFHYGKHLRGYIDNLNNLTLGTNYEQYPLETIVKFSEGAIFNNAGQVLNHSLYFAQFRSPKTANTDALITEEAPKLSAAITAQWGSLQAFRDEFTAKGEQLFGSGWVWLSMTDGPHDKSKAEHRPGMLVITQEAGAGNPVARGMKPILTFDVWEHAYYLDYQNRRADYLKALWSIINWKVLEKRYNG